MKDPLGVSPSKGNQGTTRGKEKMILTSVGIEPTTSGLDLPLLCRLSYEVGQRKSGTILGRESRRRESKGTYECLSGYNQITWHQPVIQPKSSTWPAVNFSWILV